ncbi:MAG: hypothetical protein RL220_619 [Bacteroidota bacterium]|jgi:anthranilate synthase component 2
MGVLIIDNFDSFTYNLYHMLSHLGDHKIEVVRNTSITPEEALGFDAIVISPGPGLPSEAGSTPDIIRICAGKRPILGVCLGMQAMAEVFGGKLKNLSEVKHGRSTIATRRSNDLLFEGLPDDIRIGHYHSWVVDDPVPDIFTVSMRSSDGLIMAMHSAEMRMNGVQFHPESVLTPLGGQMLKNWLDSITSESSPSRI